MAIGVLFTVIPIPMSMLLDITLQKSNTYFDVFIHFICVMVIFCLIVLIFIINYLSASITTENQSITKYLYKLFKDNNSNQMFQYNLSRSNILLDTRLILTIDTFIKRLNDEYICFHCLNSFKFTKLAFYQFLYTFASAYTLVKRFY